MFQLHDKTRRWICLAGFFLFCIAPTIGIIAWCAMRHLPSTASNAAKELGSRLGMEVRFKSLVNVRPGVVRYESFELSDPETNRCLLKSPSLEIQWKATTDNNGIRTQMLLFSASHPEIETAGLQQLGRLLQRVMQEQSGQSPIDFQVFADRLTLLAGVKSQTLTDVQARLANPPGSVRAIAVFHLPGEETRDLIRIDLVRNRQTNPPANGFELNTGGNQLPCDLLAAVLPEFGMFGSQSRFNGYLWANQDCGSGKNDNWSGELRGQLLGIDLNLLVSEHFPHKLSGMADIVIESSKFSHGKLDEAKGRVDARKGIISRSLLQAAVKYMKFGSNDNLVLFDDQVPYELLAMELYMNARGLWLEGRCSSNDRNIVMADRRLVLLTTPAEQPLPVATLIQTLVPENAVQVPATSQTDWLVTHLPMPQIVAPQSQETTIPAKGVRLRKQ